VPFKGRFGNRLTLVHLPGQSWRGLVGRGAFPGDNLCVIPAVRAQASGNNAQARSHKLTQGQINQIISHVNDILKGLRLMR
jgi:hypothetical protein